MTYSAVAVICVWWAGEFYPDPTYKAIYSFFSCKVLIIFYCFLLLYLAIIATCDTSEGTVPHVVTSNHLRRVGRLCPCLSTNCHSFHSQYVNNHFAQSWNGLKSNRMWICEEDLLPPVMREETSCVLFVLPFLEADLKKTTLDWLFRAQIPTFFFQFVEDKCCFSCFFFYNEGATFQTADNVCPAGHGFTVVIIK